MNWIKVTTVAALVAVAPAATLAAVEKPQIMQEAMISITVSDLHGFLDEAGSVAAQVQPMMSGAMIKSMVGMQVGDPGLAGIPAGSGLAIVAMDPTNIFAVIEVAEAQSAGYITVAQSQQLLAKYDGGVLLVAGTPEALAQGVAHSSHVKSALLSKRSASLQMAMQPSTMLVRNKEAVDAFMKMMPAMLGQSMMSAPGATLESTQTTAKILEGELIVALSLARQIEAAEIKLEPKGGSIQLSKTFVPKAGTGLAKLVNAPVLNKENPKINCGLLDHGTVLVEFNYANAEALGEFIGTEVEFLMNELKLEDVDAPSIIASMKKWFGMYGDGTGCEMVSFSTDGEMKVQYVTEVKDAATSMELLKNMDTEMAPFFKMYESFGMPMKTTFKENVRKSNDIQIHQLTMTMGFDGLATEQREQMEAMGLSNIVYEVAVDNGLMFYSGKGEMEGLIKRVKTSSSTQSPLKARSVYPSKGGFYYFDLDMGEYMAFASQMLPDLPETAMMKQQMATLFEGVEPVTSAGFKQDGRVMWSVNIPGELVAKYGQMAMMVQMQQMQQQQMGAPGGAAPQAMPAQ